MNIIPTPRSLTFAQTMRRGVLTALASCALLASAVFAVSTLPTNMTFAAPESSAVDHKRDAAAGSQAAVIAKSGCKTAPEGVLPSSVVADPAGDRSWTHMTSERALTQAFEQLVFDGVLEGNEFTKSVDHGMRVGVFCK